MAEASPSRLQWPQSSQSVLVGAPPPWTGHMAAQGETLPREATSLGIVGLGAMGRSGNPTEDVKGPLLLGRAGLWTFQQDKAMTRHGHFCSFQQSTSLHPSPLPRHHHRVTSRPLATMPSLKPTAHVKVIIFKIAFSKHQKAWSTHHQEPWPDPQRGRNPARDHDEPKMVGTWGSLHV